MRKITLLLAFLLVSFTSFGNDYDKASSEKDAFVYTPANSFTGTTTNEPTAVDDTATYDGSSSSISISVLANDSFGSDGPNLTHHLTFSNGSTSNASANGGPISVGNNGTPGDLTDDVIIYTPPSGFTGSDTFTYVITDTTGDASTGTVTISVSNTGVGYSPDFATVNQDTSNNIIDVMANDADDATFGPSDTRFLIVSADHLTGSTEYGGTVTLETYSTSDTADDVILYTPKSGFFGTDTFSYVPGNDRNALVLVTVTVNQVVSVNGTPTANNDSVTVFKDSSANVIDVLDNDTSGSDGYINGGLTMTNGTLVSASTNGGSISIDQKGTSTTSDDVFNYTPPSGFTGTDTFGYTITDASGDAASATVTVTVNAITNVPTAGDDTVTVVEDSSNNVINMLANDSFGTDGGAAINPIVASTPSTNGGTVVVSDNALIGDPSDDVILYTPASSFTGTDSFTYTLTDSNGDFATATVNITVSSAASVNTTPSANDDTASATQNGSAVNISVLSNDDFGTNGPSTSHSLTFPNGSLSNASANGASITINNNGTTGVFTDDFIVYTPTQGFSGTDTFTYTITDVDGDADSATVTVTVSASGQTFTPNAVDDSATVITGSGATEIDVLDNDEPGSDGYIDGGLTMTNGTLTSASTNGGAISVDQKGTSSTSDDVFNYTPPAGFTGTDTFQYTITDASGDADTATVTVTVNAISNDPVAGDDNATVVKDSSNNVINMLTNDSFGTEGQYSPPVSFSAGLHTNGFYITTITTAQGGTAVLTNNDSEIQYTPASGFTGTDSFVYYIYDGNGDRDGATVNITVTATPVVNGTPTAVDDSASATQKGPAVNIMVLSNDNFGTDGANTNHSLTFSNGSLSNASVNGAPISVNNNGTSGVYTDDYIVYTPTDSFTGTDSFTYVITDANGDASTGTVTITVSGAAGVYVPVANDDSASVVQNSSSNSIDVLDNDTIGLDGFVGSHGLRLQGGLSQRFTANGGFMQVNEGGTPNDPSDDVIEYTPANGFTGTETFTYTITDATGDASTATVTVTVNAVPKVKTVESNDIHNNNFTVYPNPSKGFVNTQIESASATKALLYVVDVTGKVVFRRDLNLTQGINNVSFNLDRAKGVMFIRVIGNNQNFGTKKVIFE